MTIHHHHYSKYSLPLGYVVHILGLVISSIGFGYVYMFVFGREEEVIFYDGWLGIGYSFLYVSEKGEGVMEYKGWPGKFKYLTFWSQLTLPVYFLLCILNDVSGGNTTDRQQYVHRTGLQKLRDYFHAVWVFPIGIFVVSSFWMIYAVDRELVYPKSLDKIIPVWLNHVSHTSPLVLLLLEKIFVNISYPRWRNGLAATTGITLLYISWILWIAQTQGIWAYPVLQVLNMTWRTVFLSLLAVYMGLVYLSGQWLSKELWWGPAHHAKPKKQ